jgi:hypothetical protein
MDATLTRISIVNARNTDGYALVYEYSDGTQSGAQGWYGSIEEAFAAAIGALDYPDIDDAIARAAADGVSLEDWTSDDE